MSATERAYRLRVAVPGAAQVEGYVDFMLTLAALAGIPIVTTAIVHPTDGRTEMRPFTVEAIDKSGALTAALTDGERWRYYGRLVDVQYSDSGSSDWLTYGVGRLSAISEGNGPGQYSLEVSDESWLTRRRADLFAEADTVMVWPNGIKGDWRGYPAAKPAAAQLLSQFPNVAVFKVTAGAYYAASASSDYSITAPGQEVTDRLISFLEADLVDNPDFRSVPPQGNFKTARFNYDGQDYEIFHLAGEHPTTDGVTGDPVASLRSPEIRFAPNGQSVFALATRALSGDQLAPYSLGRLVSIYVSVVTESGASLPDHANAYIHRPLQASGSGVTNAVVPTDDAPLHIGIADGSHPWGTAEGGIHVADLTARVWSRLGVQYDASALAELEADDSLPRLWFRLTEVPQDVERWLEENAWGPCMLMALTDNEGRRLLVDMRLPQDLDPASLPVLDASNSSAVTWRNLGSEAVTSLRWKYLATRWPSVVASDASTAPSVKLDGLITEERDWPPMLAADAEDSVQPRELSLSLLGAMEPTADTVRVALARLSGGANFRDFTAGLSPEIFDIFQDGPMRGTLEVGRSMAESLRNGAVVVVDADSLKLPNPRTGARTSLRLMRVVARTAAPASHELELLDLGPSAQPLDAPSVGIEQESGEASVLVTIGGVPSGATATMQVGFTDASAPPTAWPIILAGLTDGVYRVAATPDSLFAWARAKALAAGRMRSPWATASVELDARPRIPFSLSVNNETGFVSITANPSALTGGVRLTFARFFAGESPTFSFPQDLDAADFSSGPWFTGVRLDLGEFVTVRLEPWTGFAPAFPGTVTGSGGPAVELTVQCVRADTSPNVPQVVAVRAYPTESPFSDPTHLMALWPFEVNRATQGVLYFLSYSKPTNKQLYSLDPSVVLAANTIDVDRIWELRAGAFFDTEFSLSMPIWLTILPLNQAVPAGSFPQEVTAFAAKHAGLRVDIELGIDRLGSYVAASQPTFKRKSLLDFIPSELHQAIQNGSNLVALGNFIPSAQSTLSGGGSNKGALPVQAGRYLLDSDLETARGVSLLGDGAANTEFYAESEVVLDVVAGDADEGIGAAGAWRHLIADILFRAVRLRYGATTDDYGNGATVRGCRFTQFSIAIEYVHNSWICLVHDVIAENQLSPGGTAIKFSLADAGSNTGARMVVSACGLFGVDVGGDIDGNTSDGHHIIFTDTDIEHTLVAAIRSNTSEGVLNLTNMHFELNFGITLKLSGNSTFVTGMWCFLSGTTHDVFCELGWGDEGQTWLGIRDSRLQWETGATYGKLCRLLHAQAVLSLDPSTILSAAQFFGAGGSPMATADSTAGQIINGGFPAVKAGGKVFAAWRGEFVEPNGGDYSTTLTIVNGGGGKAVDVLMAFDATSREWTMEFQSAAPVANNALHIDFSGASTLVLTMPVVAGGGRLRIVYRPGYSLEASITYNGTYVRAVTAAPAHTATRLMTISYIGSGSSQATLTDHVGLVL